MVQVNHLHIKVEDLIDNRHWNSYLVCETFGDDIGNIVLRIPLGPDSSNERFIWNENSSGTYTVKSAYHKAKSMLGHQHAQMQFSWEMCKIIWEADIMLMHGKAFHVEMTL